MPPISEGKGREGKGKERKRGGRSSTSRPISHPCLRPRLNNVHGTRPAFCLLMDSTHAYRCLPASALPPPPRTRRLQPHGNHDARSPRGEPPTPAEPLPAFSHGLPRRSRRRPRPRPRGPAPTVRPLRSQGIRWRWRPPLHLAATTFHAAAVPGPGGDGQLPRARSDAAPGRVRGADGRVPAARANVARVQVTSVTGARAVRACASGSSGHDQGAACTVLDDVVAGCSVFHSSASTPASADAERLRHAGFRAVPTRLLRVVARGAGEGGRKEALRLRDRAGAGRGGGVGDGCCRCGRRGVVGPRLGASLQEGMC